MKTDGCFIACLRRLSKIYVVHQRKVAFPTKISHNEFRVGEGGKQSDAIAL